MYLDTVADYHYSLIKDDVLQCTSCIQCTCGWTEQTQSISNRKLNVETA